MTYPRALALGTAFALAITAALVVGLGRSRQTRIVALDSDGSISLGVINGF